MLDCNQKTIDPFTLEKDMVILMFDINHSHTLIYLTHHKEYQYC